MKLREFFNIPAMFSYLSNTKASQADIDITSKKFQITGLNDFFSRSTKKMRDQGFNNDQLTRLAEQPEYIKSFLRKYDQHLKKKKWPKQFNGDDMIYFANK